MVSLSSECRPRLARLIQHLTQQCGWKSQHVHLFGFSQGGTAALDFTLHSRSVAIRGNPNRSWYHDIMNPTDFALSDWRARLKGPDMAGTPKRINWPPCEGCLKTLR